MEILFYREELINLINKKRSEEKRKKRGGKLKNSKFLLG